MEHVAAAKLMISGDGSRSAVNTSTWSESLKAIANPFAGRTFVLEGDCKYYQPDIIRRGGVSHVHRDCCLPAAGYGPDQYLIEQKVQAMLSSAIHVYVSPSAAYVTLVMVCALRVRRESVTVRLTAAITERGSSWHGGTPTPILDSIPDHVLAHPQ